MPNLQNLTRFGLTRFGVMAVTLSVALSGCGMLRPKLDMETVTPKGNTMEMPNLAFISPTAVGSWVVVAPEALAFKPRAASGTVIDELGFVGLRPMIERMLAQNPTLQQAQARLKQAQAVAGINLGALLPSLTAQADISRGRSAPVNTNNTNTETQSNVGVNANLPIDLFGRITGQLRTAKRLRDSADAEVVATKLALKAAVAQTYIQLLAAHKNVESWQHLMAAAEEQNRLVQLRYAAGDLPLTATQPVFATLQSLRVQALAAAQTEQQLHYTLAALLGEAPQTFALPEADLARLMEPAVAAPTQVSATLLLARPDVRAAAAQLAATNANIGSARAAFLPNISISGNAGYRVGETGNLFDWNNRAWAIGPIVTLPIFQGGTNVANLKRAWGQYNEAVGIYRGQVLNAYQETADALTAMITSRSQAQSAATAAAALQTAAEATQNRYKLGDISKAEALDAEIQSQQANVNATNAMANTHTAVVELARSLGGGW